MPIEAFAALVILGVIIFSSQLREAYARASASVSDDKFKTIKTNTVKFLTSMWFWGPVLIIWLFGFGGFTKLVTDPWGFGDDRVAALEKVFTPDNKQELVSVQGNTMRYEYMLNLAEPKLEKAKLRVSDYAVCERGLRSYEDGKTAEAKQLGVYEGSFMDRDTGVILLQSALICDHGPNGQDVVIWRGDAERIAYISFWEEKKLSQESFGHVCTPKSGWECKLAPPRGRGYHEEFVPVGKCIRWQGVDPFGHAFDADVDVGNPKDSSDHKWKLYSSDLNHFKGVRFVSIDQNYAAVYFRFYDKVGGQC